MKKIVSKLMIIILGVLVLMVATACGNQGQNSTETDGEGSYNESESVEDGSEEDSEGETVGNQAGDSTEGTTGDQTGDQTGDSTEGTDGEQTGNQAGDSTEGTAGDQTGNQSGNTSNGFVVEYEYFKIIGNSAYEIYEYKESAGAKYSSIVNELSDAVKGNAQVYVMPVPLAGGVILPEEYKSHLIMSDNEYAIDNILSGMNSDVIGVDIYHNLVAHKDEYIYFRADTHWTQLGAYYAYEEFCKAKGVEIKSLDTRKAFNYGDFLGIFYDESRNQALKNTPDTLYAWAPASECTMRVTTTDGTQYDWAVVNDVSKYTVFTKYSGFIAGDNPFSVIDNKDINDGSSCVVIKESFGNAFVPLLVDHYDKVYVIDYRYWTGSLASFVEENHVQDIILVNNLGTMASNYLLGKLKGIIY